MSKRSNLESTLQGLARSAINAGDSWNMDFDIWIDEILNDLGIEIVTTEEVRPK